MATQKKNHRPLKPGERLVFTKRFWHKAAKRFIEAPPGKVFCFIVCDDCNKQSKPTTN